MQQMAQFALHIHTQLTCKTAEIKTVLLWRVLYNVCHLTKCLRRLKSLALSLAHPSLCLPSQIRVARLEQLEKELQEAQESRGTQEKSLCEVRTQFGHIKFVFENYF